jgi:hypothetical protein
MKPKTNFQKIVGRLVITGLIAIVFVAALNEVSYRFRKTNTDRAPEVFELVIPAGTADEIAGGGDTTSIPDEMSFIVGDTLLVKNQDSVDHQMGPLWVPAGATASLAMEEKNKYAYNCSFKSTQYLGLNVLPRTTWGSRLTALGLAAPPTTMFLFVYSLIMFPLDKDKSSDKRSRRGNNGKGITETKDELETLT